MDELANAHLYAPRYPDASCTKLPNSVESSPHRCVDFLKADADAALLFYDYFLTLDWELARYWCRAITWPTVLFFANRYGTLLGNIPIVILNFWTAPASPNKILMYCILFELHAIGFPWLIRCSFCAPTYALYERNKRVLAFMLAFSAGVIGISVWATLYYFDHNPAADKGSVLPLDIGCAYAVSGSKGLIIAWSTMGMFDCMIFLLTLYKTLGRRRPTGLDLLPVLMRDGGTVACTLVVSNICNILSYALGTPDTRGLFNTATNVISSLMISRLMLNIRDPALAPNDHSGSQGGSTCEWGVGVFSTHLEEMPPRPSTAAGWV
ncbi:hypothetical protein GGX14DRAFT_610907 [Mycena pura]|uniref:DUF6533 domain-containing protein n=1 Tax=Mycena pura TaxID=153505 RepID=A0AAD6VMI0_9AGAR|nr:hypothetical protein GGX14DRAFT_610907 [Mycena pura]